MNGRQLTLWDNIDLERGFRCLSSMELEAAIGYFSRCLESGTENRERFRNYIDISMYWNERILLPERNGLSAGLITDLVSEISNFEFSREMSGLKRSLLEFVAGLAPKAPDLPFESIEKLFDLLIQEKEYEKAEKMIQGHYQNDPQNKILLYLMAQARWLIDDHAEANRIYTIALFASPENLPLQRIENPKLRDLIISVGASMAPAYGWIRSILPFVPIESLLTLIVPETHALQCYRLLQESQRALRFNDMPACIGYRKQLKSLAPELYEAYFNLLKFRKAGFSVTKKPLPGNIDSQ